MQSFTSFRNLFFHLKSFILRSKRKTQKKKAKTKEKHSGENIYRHICNVQLNIVFNLVSAYMGLSVPFMLK